ncbi:MAG: cobyrinate a,c-diamide synthase, partial [Rhizobiales bacterium]|nr:cobyrinate a,c-diamide synthase [Hyphomicrobiales bacterium]
IEALIADTASDAEMLVIEGAMGLFDGVPGEPGRSGAAADLAARFNLPVLLVLDVSGQSQSAAAVAAGFANYNPAVRIGGVVLNRLGSDRHRTLIADALKALGIPVLGAIPRDETLILPKRHLGLVQASEHADLAARIGRFADVVERHLDLDAIAAMAAPFVASRAQAHTMLAPPGQRIALASDEAFTFVYAHVLDGWRRAGAEIVPFSPLRDEAPPQDCDACWLPGGYPELHAGRLAAARNFLDGLTRFAQSRPVHGECGGYMVLGETIEDAQGVRHAMAGLLGHATSFAKRKLHLGYRQARLLADGPLGVAGEIVRGHEYHHASITTMGEGDERLVDATDAQGRPVAETGSRRGRVSGTFFHAIAREG